MKLCSNKEQVYDLLQKVKQNGRGYFTNLFIDQEKLDNWLQNGLFHFTDVEQGILFYRKDGDFYHLYYCVSSLTDLPVLLATNMPDAVVVTDIIGKMQDVAAVGDLFLQGGFKQHTVLERLTKINKEGSDNYALSSEVRVASESDSDRIAEMLKVNFDPYSEQVYTLEDVRYLVRDDKVIVIKDENRLKGLLIRNILPQSTVLNNFLVDPVFRGEKIGLKVTPALHGGVERSEKDVAVGSAG